MKNLFISTSPLVTTASVDLIKSRYRAGKYQNYIFIFQKYKEDMDCIKVPDNTFIMTYVSGKLYTTISSLICYKRDMNEIIDGHEANLFVGNCCHLATNYVAIKSKRFKEKYLVIDGIANYYKASSKLCGGKFKRYSKYILGALLGLPYSDYKGHISGSDTGKFKSIYCYNKELLVSNPGEVKIIHISNTVKSDSTKKKITVLVLEQPIEQFMFKNKIELARYALRKYVDNLPKNKIIIYIKRHPSFKMNELEIPDGWKMVEKAIPAEMLFRSLDVTHVVSYTSSALLTIKEMDRNIHSVSIGVNLIKNDEARGIVSNLFRSRGIEIITA